MFFWIHNARLEKEVQNSFINKFFLCSLANMLSKILSILMVALAMIDY